MLRPVAWQIRLSRTLCPEASTAAVTHHACSVATEVYHQFLGQDFHLLDDDALTAPLTDDVGS
jgi:hypothetical protein